MIPAIVIWIAIAVCFLLLIVNSDHTWHNIVRRGFGLKEESIAERWKRMTKDDK